MLCSCWEELRAAAPDWLKMKTRTHRWSARRKRIGAAQSCDDENRSHFAIGL